MVQIPEIPEVAIPIALLAVFLAFLLRLVEWGIRRIWKRRMTVRRDKIRWYQELTELLKEIKFTATARRGSLEYWQSKSPQAAENFEEEYLEGLRKYLKQFGIEDPDQFIESKAGQLLMGHQRSVQDQLKTDMKIFETSLIHHLSKYPEDVDETILEECGKLLQILDGMGRTGQITPEVEESIWERADTVVSGCNDASSELNGWL